MASSSSKHSTKVTVNGHEVQGNSRDLKYFPRDDLVRNIDEKRLDQCIEMKHARCYVLFIPQSAYINGARTFTQFDEATGKMHRTLLELFCILRYRKATVQQNGLDAATLLVERAVGPQGETRGWFFFLYDVVVDAPLTKEPKKTHLSVSAYIGAVAHHEDIKAFQHLIPSGWKRYTNVARPSPFDFWPAIQQIREEPLQYQRAVSFYLDIVGSTITPLARILGNATHDLNPVRVFTLENAIKRYNRCYGCAWFKDQPVTSMAQFAATFPRHRYSSVPMPSNPAETTLMTPSVLVPACLALYMKPEDHYSADALSPAFLAYASQHAFSNHTEEEKLARFQSQIGTVLGVPAHVTMADFFETFKTKAAAAKTPQERRRVARMGFASWASVWNPLMAEGQCYAAMVDWSSQTLRSSLCNNFCLAMRVAHPKISVIGNIVKSLYQSIDVFKGVASAHQMILLQILMMHSASYIPESTKNLKADYMKAGPAAASKTFADFVAKSLCVPKTVMDVAYATDKAELSSENERGFIQVTDEINIAQLGADRIHHRLSEFYESIINPPPVSSNTTEGFAKNAATNRERMVRHATINDVGARVTINTSVVNYGVKTANTNAGSDDLPPATASRWLFYMTRNDEGNAFDGLDKMTAAHFSKMDAVCSKNYRALSQWMHRNHYLSTLLHITTEARLIPPPDQSLFCRRYNMVAHYLQQRGMPKAREKRNFEKTWQVALELLHWEVIAKVFDLGIGGPDPSRPWREQDLEYVIPFFYLDDPIGVMAMELVPALNDRVLFSTMHILRHKILEEHNLPDLGKVKPHYYCSASYFTDLSDQRVWRKCEFLANAVVSAGSPYDIRTVFAVLAKLTKLCVPMVDNKTGKIVAWEAGWLIEMPGLVLHKKLIDNLASENVIFDAYNAVIDTGGRETEVVRGANVPGNPSQLQMGVLRSTNTVDEELKKLQAMYEAKLEKWNTENKKELEDLEAMPEGTAKNAKRKVLYRRHPGDPPQPEDIPNPTKMRNPNWRNQAFVDALGQGTLGVADADDVTTLLSEQEELVTSKASDRDDAVEAHLLNHGFDPANRTHFAFPAITEKLVDLYEQAFAAVNEWRVLLKKPITEVEVADLADAAWKAVKRMCIMWNGYRNHQAMPEPLNHSRFIDAWLRKRLVEQPMPVIEAIFRIWQGWPRHSDKYNDETGLANLAEAIQDYYNARVAAVPPPPPVAPMDVDVPVAAAVAPVDSKMAMDVDLQDPPPPTEADEEEAAHAKLGYEVEADSDDEEEPEDDGGAHERELQRRSKQRERALEEEELRHKARTSDADDDDEEERGRRRAQVREKENSNAELKHPKKSRFAFAAFARPPQGGRPLPRQVSVDANDTAMCITPLN